MITDLEEQLRTEFALDADLARLTSPEWYEVTVVPEPGTRHGVRWLRVSAAAAVLILALGGIAVIATRSQDDSDSVGFVPAGEELPLIELPLTASTVEQTVDMGRVAKPGSVHVISIAGDDAWVMRYDAVDYAEFSGTVHPFHCMGYSGMGSCAPEETVLGGSSDGKRARWVDVPSNAAFVGYTDGAGHSQWQRPVGGMAMFPTTSNTDGHFTAWAEDGTVLETLDFAAPGPPRDLYGGAVDTLTPDQEDQLHYMTRDLTKACLVGEGATFPSDKLLPVMDASAGSAAWEKCVAETKAAVDEQFSEWGGRLALRAAVATEPIPSDTTNTPGTQP
jgi:hypothetical protein